jgi:hypothetical protein
VIDAILMPEVEARKALRDRKLRLSVLSPLGTWLGCGRLRVLRCKVDATGETELIAGYERYEPLK